MKLLAALLLLAATPALAQEGGRDPFALRTPGITTVVPTDGSPTRPAIPAEQPRATQASPASRPAADVPAPAPPSASPSAAPSPTPLR